MVGRSESNAVISFLTSRPSHYPTFPVCGVDATVWRSRHSCCVRWSRYDRAPRMTQSAGAIAPRGRSLATSFSEALA